MAFAIIKRAVKTPFSSLKFYMYISFFVIDCVLDILANQLHHSPLLDMIFFLCSIILIDTPLYMIYCKKGTKQPAQCVRKKFLKLLVYATICTSVFFLISMSDIRIFFFSNADITTFLSCFIGFWLIEIIKTDSGIKGSLTNLCKTFSQNTLSKLWLLIKVIFLEILFSDIVTLILALPFMIFARLTASHIGGEVLSWAVLILQNLIYPFSLAVDYCCYEAISAKV